jgi:formylglycine-generating enzyme required for sulfatase activity
MQCLRPLGLGAIVVAAGCNAVLGNDSVSLWDGGGTDAMARDATPDRRQVGDAGREGGPASSTRSSSSSGSGSGSSSSQGCTPSAHRCIDAGVEMCDQDGAWSIQWPCATGACSQGACTGPAATPRSCAVAGDGTDNCGAGGGESCCTSLEVPGGTYDRAYDPIGVDGGVMLAADGGPRGVANPATVSGFRLDEYDVTVGRFRRFVDDVIGPDGGVVWLPESGSGKHSHLNAGAGLNATGGGYEPGWSPSDNAGLAPTDSNLSSCAVGSTPYGTWTSVPATRERLPINCVTWQEAYAFCIWDGGFLPSEAEWELAAAAGSEQREYPWGGASPGTQSQYAIYGCDFPAGAATCVGVANIAPVGSATRGAALWGQMDLAGEVWQWNLDWYATYTTQCSDCADVGTGTNRVLRGGSFSYGPQDLLSAYRSADAPTLRNNSYGVRCARVP